MFEKSINLYDENDKKMMTATEKSFNARWDNRVDQLVKFSTTMGFKKLGIANCLTFEKEAKILEQVLKNKGFKIISTNCREKHLDKSEYTKDASGASCNPASQAKKMNDEKVDLVITLGLCLGHDLVFQKQCKIPTTNLIVKDFTYKHDLPESLKE